MTIIICMTLCCTVGEVSVRTGACGTMTGMIPGIMVDIMATIMVGMILGFMVIALGRVGMAGTRLPTM